MMQLGLGDISGQTSAARNAALRIRFLVAQQLRNLCVELGSGGTKANLANRRYVSHLCR